MSLFSSDSTCDWCGSTFEGEGLTGGAMTFCSQACLDQRNAPAAVEPVEVRPLSHAMAMSELAIAETEAQHYFDLTRRYNVNCTQPDFMETQHTYIGVWQKLDTLRAFATARGADASGYDGHRVRFDAFPDSWESNPHDDSFSGTAKFPSQNVSLLLAAAAEMRRLLAAIDPD